MKELKDIPKENPFRVPDGYFDNLTERMISATSGIEPAREKKAIIRKLRVYSAIAATVALLAITGATAYYLFLSERHGSSGPEITLGEFNELYLNDIDLLTLEENIADTEELTGISGINTKDIIDYLVAENIDINDIYEQLQ